MSIGKALSLIWPKLTSHGK